MFHFREIFFLIIFIGSNSIYSSDGALDPFTEPTLKTLKRFAQNGTDEMKLLYFIAQQIVFARKNHRRNVSRWEGRIEHLSGIIESLRFRVEQLEIRHERKFPVLKRQPKAAKPNASKKTISRIALKRPKGRRGKRKTFRRNRYVKKGSLNNQRLPFI